MKPRFRNPHVSKKLDPIARINTFASAHTVAARQQQRAALALTTDCAIALAAGNFTKALALFRRAIKHTRAAQQHELAYKYYDRRSFGKPARKPRFVKH